MIRLSTISHSSESEWKEKIIWKLRCNKENTVYSKYRSYYEKNIVRDSDHILCHGNGSCRIRDGVGKESQTEFRGAWLHVIGQNQWQDKSTEQAKAYIRDQFDKLAGTGCNTVIFQVRPTADAVYRSELEPWSAWLTGKRGKAPSPMWDPMEYAIGEAHKRGVWNSMPGSIHTV